MNPNIVPVNRHSTSEDGIARTSTGYSLPLSGMAAVEPGVVYNNWAAMTIPDVQQHSLDMNIFAHGLFADVIPEHHHVPLTQDPRYPVNLNRSPYSSFDQHVQAPQVFGETNNDANQDFWAGLHSPLVAGSVPMFHGQPLTTGGTRSSIIPPTWPRSNYFCGGPAASDGGLLICKDTDDIHPSRFEGATLAHTFPSTFPSGSSSGLCPTQSSSSTFPPSPLGYLSTPTSISQGSAYQGARGEIPRPLSPSRRNVLSRAELSGQPASHPVLSNECTGQERPVRTMRSVRTRYGDVYAEYEPATDGPSGRWVCQCDSTFVRDSDWERHAMHSLSHSVGGGFDCNICDISFTRSDAMFRHRRKKHGDTRSFTQGTQGAGG